MGEKHENILARIGNTPLVPITVLNPNPRVQILAKMESFNPGGSVKDRAALYMIDDAEAKGEPIDEKTIVEATSGNTGIGLSLVAAVKGYRVLLVMAESVSEERKKILRAMGADLEFTPAHLSTDGAIEFVYNLVREEPEKYWLADQFNNDANWKAHYHGTATEIWNQTGGNLHMIIATMGTTGTLMGLARRFQELQPSVQIVGVEPYMGHKIQGLKNMKESYAPGIFDRSLAHKIVNIEDDEAFETARMLARKEGIFVGMSSGAAIAVALREAKAMKEGRIVVILPDGGERYLSTPLFVDKKKTGLLLFNTLTRKKEEFVPLKENQVSMYTCGPTLCQPIHIGQCRRFLFADLARRYLEFNGYTVNHVMNVTDLDDRTIEGAEKAGLSLKDYTEEYYQAFLSDLDTLNVKRASLYPRASENVEDMIHLIGQLIQKGYAYEKFRSVYFDISRFRDYGRLSRIDLEKIKLGKTVDLEEYDKDNPRDFTLLKRSTLSELKKGIFYKTQWGNVRPSWHLECPAMAMKFLGEKYDIHTSGIDLVFPHHENAIAIVQALTGMGPANYWLHNEFVMVEGKPYSRFTEGHGLTVKDFLKRGFSGRVVRYWLLSRHYRKPLTFSWTKLETVKNTLHHLDSFIQRFHACPLGQNNGSISQLVYNLRRTFTEALDDDFNMARALGGLFQFIGRINQIMDAQGISKDDGQKIEGVLQGVNAILGVMNMDRFETAPEIDALIKEREQAREAKDWSKADQLRGKLREMGIEVVDGPNETLWRKID